TVEGISRLIVPGAVNRELPGAKRGFHAVAFTHRHRSRREKSEIGKISAIQRKIDNTPRIHNHLHVRSLGLDQWSRGLNGYGRFDSAHAQANFDFWIVVDL